MEAERTETCEDCGGVFAESYGRWWHTNLAARWRCHECGNRRAKRNAK